MLTKVHVTDLTCTGCYTGLLVRVATKVSKCNFSQIWRSMCYKYERLTDQCDLGP
jgi:hypothetical protein